MNLSRIKKLLPGWKNAGLAVLSAVLLILAFPDFEFWFLAWFALVPLLFAIEREKQSPVRSFIVGWAFGFVFFSGTCWWLTFAPITYARFPWPLAYFLLFCVTAIVGIFPAIFAAVLSILLKRFGPMAVLAAPFVWVFTEFLRYWLTGNNWNAIGYSQALGGWGTKYASLGGIYLSGCIVVLPQTFSLFVYLFWKGLLNKEGKSQFNETILHGLFGWSVLLSSSVRNRRNDADIGNVEYQKIALFYIVTLISAFVIFTVGGGLADNTRKSRPIDSISLNATIIAIQPNVPMSGLTYEKWKQLRQKHVELAESVLQKPTTDNRQLTTVIFPESPMNFAYEEDEEFRQFVHEFAARHDVNVLFNSAEPDPANKKYFNSAVLVGREGKEIAQYDKIYLVPFGESVPAPLHSIVPAFVGSFSYGSEYDLLPLGDAKAGVMICFESHFGELSREYVRNGADVIIEMTNDGYLGPTPVLRQHLANAVFRAVETNRPVLRVTNVGITAYINERGEVIEPTQGYTEDTRVWSVAKSDGSRTFYVKYGDWFAWLCSIVTIGLLIFGLIGQRSKPSRNGRVINSST